MSVRLTALKLILVSHLTSAAADRTQGVLRFTLLTALLVVAGLTADGALADGDCVMEDEPAGARSFATQFVEQPVEVRITQPSVSLPSNRDATLDLPFTMRDQHGYPTLPPGQLELTVIGPDGEPVDEERIMVSLPKGEDSSTRIRITNFGAEQPLAPGRYTVRAQHSELPAEVHFYIAGPPATVKLRVDANTSYYVRSSVLTVTATVLDANGAIVPDGAEVTFTVTGDLEVRNVASYTDETTTSGTASARYIIMGRAGTATFSATSGEASGSALVELGAVPPSLSPVAPTESEPTESEPAEPAPAESAPATGKAGLSSTAPGQNTWTSTAETTASALYAELALDGLTNLWIQDQSTWVHYGLDNGVLIPGSVDYTISEGAILFLVYADTP